MDGYPRLVTDEEFLAVRLRRREQNTYAPCPSEIIPINSFVYRCDEEDYFEWTSSQKCFDFSPLKQKAVTAIGAILSDNSELRELWEENEELYEAWKEDKLSMQKRLQQ